MSFSPTILKWLNSVAIIVKVGGIFHTFRCQVHLIDKRHRISIRNSLEQGSHFHRAAIPLVFHACTVITIFLLAANGVDDSLRSVETVGALEPSFIIRSPSAPPVITTLSAVVRIFLHWFPNRQPYQNRILILRSDTIALPAPERCSTRVWVFPTSILQIKIRVCGAQRSNESPSGAFKRQNGLRQQMEGPRPDKFADVYTSALLATMVLVLRSSQPVSYTDAQT